MDDKIVLDAETHAYKVNGIEFPSVTQVLDRAGLSANWGDADDLARGVFVHEACHFDDEKDYDLRTAPRALKGYVRAWRKWKRDTGFKIRMIEQRVWSATYSYCGTLDREGELPGKLLPCIVDLKSNKSGAVPSSVRYQMAAYGFALNPGLIFWRVAVILKPDGSYNTALYSPDSWTADLGVFLNAVKGLAA